MSKIDKQAEVILRFDGFERAIGVADCISEKSSLLAYCVNPEKLFLYVRKNKYTYFCEHHGPEAKRCNSWQQYDDYKDITE